MKIRPIDERVLLKVIEEEERKVGGIIIPDTASKERPQIGEVIALGDDIVNRDVEKQPLSKIIKVGDRILFAKYGGTEVKVEEEEFLLVNRSDILGVIVK